MLLSKPVNPRPISISPDSLRSLQQAAAARELPTIANPPSGIIPDAASRYDLGQALNNSTPRALDAAAAQRTAADAVNGEGLANYNPYQKIGATNPNQSSRYFDPANVGKLEGQAASLPSSLDRPPVRGIPPERIGGAPLLAGAGGAAIDLATGLASGRNLGDALSHAGAFGTGTALGTGLGQLAGGALGALIGPEGIPIGAALGGMLGGYLGGNLADNLWNMFHPSSVDRNLRQPQQALPPISVGVPGGDYAVQGRITSRAFNPFQGKDVNVEQGCDRRSFLGPVTMFAGAGSLIFATGANGQTLELGGFADAKPAGNSLRIVRLDAPAVDIPVRDPTRKEDPGQNSPIPAFPVPAARPKGAPNPTTQPTLPPLPAIQPQINPGGPDPSGIPNQTPTPTPTPTPRQSPTPTPTPTPGQSPTPTSTPGQSPAPSTGGGSGQGSTYPTTKPYPTTPYPETKKPEESNTPDNFLRFIPLATIPFAIRQSAGDSGRTQERLNAQNPGQALPPGDGPPVKGPPDSPCKGGCGAALANKMNAIDSKLGAANAAGQDAVLAAIMAKLEILDLKMGAQAVGGLSGFIDKFRKAFDKMAEWLHLDRVLNVLTFTTTLHNAYMLSNGLTQTLFSMFSNVLAAVGIKDKDGSPLNVSHVIGSTIETFAKALLGVQAVDGMKAEWKKYNRIYQAAANILWSVQSIGNSTLSALEVVGSYVGKIGNAVRKWRVVGEKAYSWMNPQPNFQNRFFTTLETTQNVVSQVDQVASEVLNIETTVANIGTQATDIQKALKEETGTKPGTATPEAAKVAAAAAASKTHSATPPVPLETQVKPEG